MRLRNGTAQYSERREMQAAYNHRLFGENDQEMAARIAMMYAECKRKDDVE